MNSLNARQVDGNNVTANDELVAVNAIMLKRTAVADNAANVNTAEELPLSPKILPVPVHLLMKSLMLLKN